DPVKIRLTRCAKFPCDTVHQKGRGNTAQHEIFDPRFQRHRISPGKTHQRVERDCHQLESDKDETKSIADTRYINPAQVKSGRAKNSPRPAAGLRPEKNLRNTDA